jgi:uncharacterized RDD family membrane protein YckC
LEQELSQSEELAAILMTPTHKYNTFAKRIVAGLIDGIIFIPFSILDNIVEDTDNKTMFIGLTLFHTICWTLYVVIGHGIYGQTIGKRLMGIKVFQLNEKNLIGYSNAFLRESVWFFSVIAGIIYLTLNTTNTATLNEEVKAIYYNDIVGMTSGIWLILELATMFFNKKRRALHDFLAGSVVVDLNELRREDLHRRQTELITSFQNK